MDVPIKHSYESKRRTPTRLVLIDGFSCSDSSPLFSGAYIKAMYGMHIRHACIYIYIHSVYIMYCILYITIHTTMHAASWLEDRLRTQVFNLDFFDYFARFYRFLICLLHFFVGCPEQRGREMKSLGWFFVKSSCPGCPWAPQGASRVCMSPTMGHIPGTRRLKGDACFSYSHHKKQATSLRTGGIILEILGGAAAFCKVEK